MLAQFLALLPRGLYDTDVGSSVRASLEGEAAALATADEYWFELLEEAHPEKTDVLMADWERVYGLLAAGDLEQRRARLMAQIRLQPTLSRVFIASMAAELLGYTPEIREWWVVRVGSSRYAAVGVSRIGAQTQQYIWHLDIDPAQTDFETFDRGPLEALIEEIKPAHTQVFVGFAGPFLVGSGQVGKDKL